MGTGTSDGYAGWDGADHVVGADAPPRVTHRDLSWEELVVEAQSRRSDARFASLSDDEVEDELSVGAAEIDAALCRWLELLAEFVVRGAWAEQGARTPGAWLSWKLGIAPSTAREHVRVALRLGEFPQTRERFAAGTLSYSKVRCVTRFGDPAFEDLLLEWADDATAAQLESVARGFRTAERARLDAARDEDDDAMCSIRGRSYADGSRTLTLRGPAEVIAGLEDEIERLTQVLVDDRRKASEPAPGAGPSEAEVGIDAPEDGGRGQAAAAGRGGDPEGSADDLPGPGERSPRLTSADRLEALACAVATAAASDTPPDTSGLDRHTLVLTAAADDLTETDDITAGAADARHVEVVPVADDHRRVRAMDRRALRRLACDAGIVLVVADADHATVDVGRRTRRTTAALRRALQRRDRSCTFPGCGATRHLHAHHVQHWADGGPTDLANLVLVCGFHHRFVHQEAWHIEVRHDGRHRYRSASGSDAVERVVTPPSASAEAVGARAPRTASAESLRPPNHAGGPFDLDMAVAALQQRHELIRESLELAA